MSDRSYQEDERSIIEAADRYFKEIARKRKRQEQERTKRQSDLRFRIRHLFAR